MDESISLQDEMRKKQHTTTQPHRTDWNQLKSKIEGDEEEKKRSNSIKRQRHANNYFSYLIIDYNMEYDINTGHQIHVQM